MCWAGSDPVLPGRIAPFGYPRISLPDNRPRLFAVLPRPSSALDARAFTMCSYRLTCFRLGISQFVLCLQYLKQLDTENVFVLTLPYSIVNVLFLGIKKAAWRFTPSRLPGIHHLWALLYVTVLFISNIVYSSTSSKALSIEFLGNFLVFCFELNYLYKLPPITRVRKLPALTK